VPVFQIMAKQQQMQKFDVVITNVLKEIDDLTSQIASLIGELDKANEKNLNNLDLLYSSRKYKLNELQNILDSDDGKKYLNLHNGEFQKWIKDTISNDEYFIELLNENVGDLSVKLRELIKKKSLLIYMKDK
jgi:hypothetical protein